jgi:hypothetical protein
MGLCRLSGIQNARMFTSGHLCSSKAVTASGESKPGLAVGEYVAARAVSGQSDATGEDWSRCAEHPAARQTAVKKQADAYALMPPNDPAQAGRASDVRLLTDARSRPCLQPDG